MREKKKLALFTSLLIAGGLLVPIATISSNNLGIINYGSGDDPSCENFWTNSDYTSLYELTQISSFSGSYTTWGTVTECYENSSGTMSAFIQSKDSKGHVAGALLYGYGSTELTPDSTLVEITGTPTWYYGQLRFTSTCSYTVKSTSWYTPETNVMTVDDWLDSSSSANTSDSLWTTAVGYGARKTTLHNVTVGTAGTKQTYVTFSDGSTTALLYYNDTNSTLKSALQSTLTSYYGQSADITGYLQCFQSSSNTMELQMCNSSDITTGTSETINVTGVSLDNATLTVSTASPSTLTATISPSNATNQNVSWSSSNTSVATVNGGTITGVSVGTSTITVTTEDGSYTDTCLVTVTNDSIAVTGVSLNQNSLSSYVGDSATLTATISPSNATNKNVTWSSSNTSVATVDDGVISSLAAGTATITITTEDGSYTDSCDLTVSENETLSEKTVSSSSNFSYGSYDTNFGIDSYDSIEYGFYRVADDNTHNGMILLYPSTDNYDYQALPGAFFNDTPINGIKKITVSYISTGGITINYGVTKTRGYSVTLAATGTSSWTTTTISCSVASCYYSVETNGQNAYINSITVGYNSSLTTNTTTTENSDYRIAPTVYSGTLTDGVSSVSVPNDITITGNTYTVNSYKTYTYYSFDYVSSHSGSLTLSSIAMIDPVDIANYYIAFHAIPANFGGSSISEDCGTLTEVNSLFGSTYARKISQYSLTTGYATAVPWNAQDGGSTPVYYEFDIALLSSYTTSNRGVGRVVMWVYGWSCYSDNEPVAVYTDDHYATFGEYLNYGTFGTRFDSQTSSDGYRTGYTNLSGSTEINAN
ncbi:MAG: Ig domain-containing protein [Erysipelotrichaceae bacterium]|nr:Ig domain-containing protein [Erysipelotrichaceae bacterium]